jgi:hypothetical protein
MSITATVIYNNNQEIAFGEAQSSKRYAIEEAMDTVPDMFLQDMDNLKISIVISTGYKKILNFKEQYNLEREYF